MKYLVILSAVLLAGCSMSLEDVEQRVNSCKAVGGEPVITKHQHSDMVAFVQCRKDGAIYSDWGVNTNDF